MRTAHRAAHGRLALALTALTASALVLAGCGASSSDAGDGGKTEITLSMQNPDVESADPATWAIVEAFEKANPDIEVTVSGDAVAEHLQKLSIAAQSDTLPDIFWVYKSHRGGDAERRASTGPRAGSGGARPDRCLPESTVANFSAGDVVYGVPYQGLLTGLWVNKKILADNGIEMPKTFDDLLSRPRR